MTARLKPDAFARVDDEHGCRRVRGAGDHIAYERGVTRRVDDRIATRRTSKPEPARIDGDRLIAFDLQRIEQKREFERDTPPLGGTRELVVATVGKRTRIEQQSRDQRRLPMIDVSDENDAERREAVRHMYPAERKRSKASSDS